MIFTIATHKTEYFIELLKSYLPNVRYNEETKDSKTKITIPDSCRILLTDLQYLELMAYVG